MLAWGFFPEILQPRDGSEDFVVAPMADALLARDPALRVRFDQRLADDPAFAKDPDARLAWLMAQMPAPASFHGEYPIAREP